MNQLSRGSGENIRRKKEERIGGAGRERRSGIGEGNRAQESIPRSQATYIG